MTRVYKSKNIQTKPSMAGKRNITKEFADAHKEDEDVGLDGLAELSKVAFTSRKRQPNWNEDELSKAVIDYFEFCAKKNMKPSKVGIQLFIGVGKSQYYDWANKEKYGAISEIISIANGLIEQQYIGRAEKFPTANIFLLKSSHQHVETSRLDINDSRSGIGTTKEELSDAISKLGLDQ